MTQTRIKITWHFLVWIIGLAAIISMIMPAMSRQYHFYYRLYVIACFIMHNIYTMMLIKVKEVEL